MRHRSKSLLLAQLLNGEGHLVPERGLAATQLFLVDQVPLRVHDVDEFVQLAPLEALDQDFRYLILHYNLTLYTEVKCHSLSNVVAVINFVLNLDPPVLDLRDLLVVL